RGLGLRMYQSCVNVASAMARAAYEASRCVGQTCREEPRATKSRDPERALLASTARAGPEKTPRSDPLGETWGRRVCNRRPKGRKKSGESPVDGGRLGPGKASPCPRRRGGSGLGGSRRIGESKRAPRRKRAPVSSGGCDRGVRGTIAQASGWKKTP